jgi:CBS domain-containing protein
MLVRDVMTTPAVAIRLDATVKEITRTLEAHAITALPVVDDAGVVVGIVSEGDVLDGTLDRSDHGDGGRRAPLPRPPFLTRAADLMSTDVVTVSPDTDLGEATELMARRTVKSLPVVRTGVVVGMVSRCDIVAALTRSDADVAQEVASLRDELGHAWEFEVADGVVRLRATRDVPGRRAVQTLVSTVPGVVRVLLD